MKGLDDVTLADFDGTLTTIEKVVEKRVKDTVKDLFPKPKKVGFLEMVEDMDKNNDNKILIFPDPNDFLKFMEQLQEEYHKNEMKKSK